MDQVADAISSVIAFFVNEVISEPFYLVGLMVLVGLLALRKPAGEILGGTLKAILGFLILSAGAGVVVAALEPLGTLILGATGAQGVVPTNEAITALAQEEFGTTTAWTMFAGFLVALAIARFTPLRYVFLTGHHILFMATMLAVVLITVGMAEWQTVAIGAVLLGTILVVMPAFTHPWMKKVTGGQKVAMGHFGSLGYIAAGAVGQLVGTRSKSTEEMKFPKSFGFMREPMVSTALAMLVIYLVFAVAYLAQVGSAEAFETIGGTDTGSYLMVSVLNALNFGVGVALILYGVRILLGEIVPAFAGIAEKIVPNAVPALDCPVVFPFAPTAVIMGFFASVVGGLLSLTVIALGLDVAFGLALILPGMVPHFFTGGAAGVFGNATGGRLGALLGGFVNGVLITFLPAFLLFVMGDLGFANTTFGDADFGWFGILVGNIAQIPFWGAVLGLLALSVALVAAASVFQRRVVDTGWTPGGGELAEPAMAAGLAGGVTGDAPAADDAADTPEQGSAPAGR